MTAPQPQETRARPTTIHLPATRARVAVVGYGYIGAVIAAALAQRGYDVTGIDVRPAVVEEANAGRTSVPEPGLKEAVHEAYAAGRLRATVDYAACAASDVIVVTVGTPLDAMQGADLTQVREAAMGVAKHLRRGQLVVFKSTMPPGTTERVVRPLLEEGSGLKCGEGFLLAFSPERLAEGHALAEFATLPVVVGGVDAASTRAAAEFWRDALDVEVVEMTSATAAELSKLACNWWIDANIAIANELAMLSDALKVDATDVIRAANTLPKGQHFVNILSPSVGVGGYCLTKDPWFVHDLGRRHGLELRTARAGREANDRMPQYTVDRIEKELRKQGRSLAGARVAVLGLSIKANTGDVRFTPAQHVLSALQQRSADLVVCDPMVHAEDAARVTSLPVGSDVEATLRDADVVIGLANHDAFKSVGVERFAELVKPGAFVFDGRSLFTKAEAAALRGLALTYCGVGR